MLCDELMSWVGHLRKCEFRAGMRKLKLREVNAENCVDYQGPLNAPFLNGLFSSRFSRGKTAH